MNPLAQETKTLQFVLQACEKVILPFINKPTPFSQKEDQTPVSFVDKAVEEKAKEIIGERHPSHTIYGEETGFNNNSNSPHYWIIDPIDGTKNFLSGSPLFGSMCCYTHQQKAMISGITFPALQTFYATDTKQTYRKQSPIHTSPCTTIANARLAATAHNLFNEDEFKRFNRVADAVALTRFGGDCHNYVCLAEGLLDVVIEADMAPYDYLPLIPIVEKAGGVISDWQGEPLDGNFSSAKKQVVATANQTLHQQIRCVLSP